MQTFYFNKGINISNGDGSRNEIKESKKRDSERGDGFKYKSERVRKIFVHFLSHSLR